MKDMEHMGMRWAAFYDEEERRWTIKAGGRWHVAQLFYYLPGDTEGGATAKAICKAHNESIKAKRVTP